MTFWSHLILSIYDKLMMIDDRPLVCLSKINNFISMLNVFYVNLFIHSLFVMLVILERVLLYSSVTG